MFTKGCSNECTQCILMSSSAQSWSTRGAVGTYLPFVKLHGYDVNPHHRISDGDYNLMLSAYEGGAVPLRGTQGA